MAQNYQDKEHKYLNPEVIKLQQVIDFMHKLHEKFMAEQESSAPKASESPESVDKKV